MGIPIVEGRGMGSADTPDAPRIAVVNQTFARRFFPAKSAIGHRFKQGWTLAGGAPWDSRSSAWRATSRSPATRQPSGIHIRRGRTAEAL